MIANAGQQNCMGGDKGESKREGLHLLKKRQISSLKAAEQWLCGITSTNLGATLYHGHLGPTQAGG